MAVARVRSDGAETALTTSLQTILTFSGGLDTGGGILQGVKLVNRSATDRTIQIHVIESGGSADNANMWDEVFVPANSSVVTQGIAYCDSAAFVQAIMDGGSAGDVNAWPIAIEKS